MTKVLCHDYTCTNIKDGICQLKEIIITDECESYIQYLDYLESPEYQNEFWCACQNEVTKVITRVKNKGKKIEDFGLVFYTTSDNRYPCDVELTEERTGVKCGTYWKLENRITEAKKMLSQYPDVLTLPIGEELNRFKQ